MRYDLRTFLGDNKNGKNVLIIAGVHGDEITPVYTLAKMVSGGLFNLKNVESVTVLNGLNMTGLKSATRELQPKNSNDLNRSLISIKDGVDGEQQLLEELISKNDVVIDIHSSPSK